MYLVGGVYLIGVEVFGFNWVSECFGGVSGYIWIMCVCEMDISGWCVRECGTPGLFVRQCVSVFWVEGI